MVLNVVYFGLMVEVGIVDNFVIVFILVVLKFLFDGFNLKIISLNVIFV